MKYNRRNGEAYYCCGYRRLSQANCDNRRRYNQDLIEKPVMEMMDEFLLQEGSIENQLQQKFSQIEKQRQESKAEIEQLTAKKKKTADDLEVFRNQLRSKVEEDVDMDTKQSVLNSLIKKLKVDQNGLIEIDFCVALGNTHT